MWTGKKQNQKTKPKPTGMMLYQAMVKNSVVWYLTVNNAINFQVPVFC